MASEAPATSPALPLSEPASTESRDADLVREKIMEAMLRSCGELGYRNVAVRNVLECYGGHRVQFWQHFANKEECFAAAYDVWSERLCAKLLEAGGAEAGWREAMRTALTALFRFVTEEPQIARALFVDVQIAGGPAMAKREDLMERLSRAVDSARREIEPRQAPPPITGTFIVGGIDASVCEHLAAGEPEKVWGAFPELMRFAVGPYFGEQAAETEFQAAHAIAVRMPAGDAAPR